MVWQSFFRGGRPHARDLCAALADSISALTPDSPSDDIASGLKEVLERLEASEDAPGAAGAEARREKLDLADSLLTADLPARLLANLNSLEFEARKDAMRLFSTVLKLGKVLGIEDRIVEYVKSHALISKQLLDGSGDPELALHCGQGLRECTRYAQIVAFLLEEPSHVALQLVDLAQHANFDVSSDAFASLRELLLVHKQVASTYMEARFQEFFEKFNQLLQPKVDYVTQRQALRILGEVLLDRSFTQVMLLYVGNDEFLQIHMNLLRDTSKSIQLEAFHVFKIFAANPRKPPKVQLILHKNRERLVKLLETFRAKREGDEAFMQDLRAVVEAIRALQPLAQAAPASTPVPESPPDSLPEDAQEVTQGEVAPKVAAHEDDAADAGSAFEQ